MTANPDSFLGTVAGVSGTVAAILGGFVLAALIELASKRGALRELFEARTHGVASARRRRDTSQLAATTALRQVVRSWLHSAYGSVDRLPDHEQLASRVGALGLSDVALMNDEVATFCSSHSSANRLIVSCRADIASKPNNREFGNWLRSVSIPDNIDRDLLIRAFHRELQSIDRAESLGRPGSLVSLDQQTETENDGRAMLGAERSIREWSESPAACEAQDAEDQSVQAESLRDEVDRLLSGAQLPRYLILGVALFAYMMGVGVVFPVLLMPGTGTTLTSHIGVFVKIALVSQLCAAVAYLSYMLWVVRKRSI